MSAQVASIIRAVTVYCSSSKSVDAIYFDAAAQLGRAIARGGWILVYGGNNVGCMGALAEGARQAGGRVIGITPQLLVDRGIADERCDELVVTASMRERKELLERRADAFVALPGGIGTFEELFEIIVGRHLGCHRKPIIILNVGGYYGPLLEMIAHAIRARFIRGRFEDLFHISATVEDAVAYLQRQHVDAPAAAPAPAPTAAAE
jgi:cytokinin riboside 5'-monophosphate phosphoribohydrolase